MPFPVNGKLRLSLVAALAAAVLMAALPRAAQAMQQPNVAGPRAEAAQLLKSAHALHDSGKTEAALALLRHYLEQHPGNNKVRLEYARLLSYATRYSEAMNAYRTVLKNEPTNLAAQIGVAKVTSWQANFPAALELYDDILSRSPQLYDAVVGKAFTLLWLGREEEARPLLELAARKHPEDKEVQAALQALPARGEPAPKPAPAASEAAPSAKEPSASTEFRESPAPARRAPAAAVMLKKTEARPAASAVLPLRTPNETKPAAIASSAAQKEQLQAGKNTSWTATGATLVLAGMGALFVLRTARQRRHRSPGRPLRQPIRLQLGPSSLYEPAVQTSGAWTDTRDAAQEAAPRAAPQSPPVAPVTPLPVAVATPAPEAPRAAAKPATNPIEGRLLLIDENAPARERICRLLESAGSEVVPCGEATAAISLLQQSRYDAVLLGETALSGYFAEQIYDALLRKGGGAERSLLLLAQRPSPPGEEDMLCLAPPFQESELLAMTRLAMRRAGLARSAARPRTV